MKFFFAHLPISFLASLLIGLSPLHNSLAESFELSEAQLLENGNFQFKISSDTLGMDWDLLQSGNLIDWMQTSEFQRDGLTIEIPAELLQGSEMNFIRFEAQPLPQPALIWIEPGTFTMGSVAGEKDRKRDEGPQTQVTFSKGFWMGKYEVTQAEYAAVMHANPFHFEGENLPAENIRWEDAVTYCATLTERLRVSGQLLAGYRYRLPTEAEWEYACRAGTETRFSYGDDSDYSQLAQYGWYVEGSDQKTHPVGEKLPNPWGLYDMHGNVWEWCQDWYSDAYPGEALVDPQGPDSGTLRVARGGSWLNYARYCRSACRINATPAETDSYRGFRVVLVEENPAPRPGFIWIEPGTFTMGSASGEKDRKSDEGPQTQVTLSKGFWMGKYEVTQAEYAAVMHANPFHFEGENLPAENIRWEDAVTYCATLTKREQASGQLPPSYEYRLPTEAEWEYACRAGTETRFSYGDDSDYSQLAQYGWHMEGSDQKTHPVGEKLPNPWGLYDMHGNVWEWCRDWYSDAYPGEALVDPQGPDSGTLRVARGGSWLNYARYCRSACRINATPAETDSYRGFRVVLAPMGK